MWGQPIPVAETLLRVRSDDVVPLMWLSTLVALCTVTGYIRGASSEVRSTTFFFKPMDDVGARLVPASSSDECPFPSRETQIGIVPALRLRTGLLASVPSSPEFAGRMADGARFLRIFLDEEPDEARSGAVLVAADVHHDHGNERDDGDDLADGDHRDGGADGNANEAPDGAAGEWARAPAGQNVAAPALPMQKDARGKRAQAVKVLGTNRGFAAIKKRQALDRAEGRKLVGSTKRACQRSAASKITEPDIYSGVGQCGSVVGAPGFHSRVVIYRLGPALVVVICFLLSPAGKALCSCRGSTDNVGLASSTGRGSTCWHAGSFNDCLQELAL